MRYKVPCWNCDGEGYVEPVDEWDSDRCSHCGGKGFLIVSELTDDNCEEAIPLTSGQGK
jgi:DnaJ-class molecular chaperone